MLVKFRDDLYPDEKGCIYEIIELRGDRAFIRALCPSLTFPPTSVAILSELERVDKDEC